MPFCLVFMVVWDYFTTNPLTSRMCTNRDNVRVFETTSEKSNISPFYAMELFYIAPLSKFCEFRCIVRCKHCSLLWEDSTMMHWNTIPNWQRVCNVCLTLLTLVTIQEWWLKYWIHIVTCVVSQATLVQKILWLWLWQHAFPEREFAGRVFFCVKSPVSDSDEGQLCVLLGTKCHDCRNLTILITLTPAHDSVEAVIHLCKLTGQQE